MAITLFHHPYTRAAGVVWHLEEIKEAAGVPYDLHFIDLMKGEQKLPVITSLNPMGKLPVLKDGDVVVSEAAAIGLYLADRYALGTLAPALDDPQRGAYLRLCLFPASVIEPACMARHSGWAYRGSNAGFGTYEDMLHACRVAIGDGPFLLGKRFTMADVIFGTTLRFMTRFRMIDNVEPFTSYIERVSARPAAQRADAKNAEIAKQHGLA